MTCLWIGETRAKTRACFTACCHQSTFSVDSSSVKLSAFGKRLSNRTPVMTVKSSPSTLASSSGRMLMRLAMARAVSGWSPVTITTFTPAACAFVTASATPSLGGSSMPYRPTNSKPFMEKLQSAPLEPSRAGGNSPAVYLRFAMQSTRRAWRMRLCIVFSMTSTAAGSFCTVQNFSTRSGAPLSTAKAPEERWPCTVSIHLFSELKGISKIFSLLACARVAFIAWGPPCTSVHARMMATSVGEPVQISSPFSSRLHSAPLFSMPQSAISANLSEADWGNVSKPASRFTTSKPSVAMPAGPTARGMHKSWTHISPLVSVPVLSEQKTETQPKVSTASIFLTNTFRLTIWSEAIMSEMVTVGNKPSGTWAKSAAQLFRRISGGERFTGEKRLHNKLRRPMTMATPAMMCTKCSIWISSVDFTLEDLMPCAILPRKVLSPVAWTRQVALPLSTVVPK
mmetsp:Transcript_89231/g.199551  ORF Transcript_89231/g.199551 Transcript_89231/m.199551 type:complete len:455 (+) Transcript_89231:1203-2567(+)